MFTDKRTLFPGNLRFPFGNVRQRVTNYEHTFIQGLVDHMINHAPLSLLTVFDEYAQVEMAHIICANIHIYITNDRKTNAHTVILVIVIV